MKAIAIIVSIITLSLFFATGNLIVTAHQPSDLELEYDFDAQVLNVTIYHDVDDPETHYIEKVEIRRNDELVIDEDYTSQPDKDSFTYSYNISAEDGDELEVTAYCSINGERTRKIDVEGSSSSGTMTIVVEPDIDSIALNASMLFNITITSGGDPVEGVVLDIDTDRGEESNINEEGGGEYNFTYTAPDDHAGDTEEIRIRAEKDGYENAEKTISFQLAGGPADPGRNGTLDGVITAGEYPFSTSFGGGEITLHWKIDAGTITMAMEGKTTGWLSIGFDPGQAMKDADMIIGWIDIDGTIHVVDAYSTGTTGPHPPDTQLGGTDDFTDVGGSESGGTTVIEFMRPLSTGDQYDKDIPAEGDMTIIWATGGSDNFNDQHARATRGTGTINFASGESSEEDDTELWPVHAFFMTIGLACMVAGMYIARFRKKEKWWLNYHKKVGLVAAGSTVLGLLIGFYMVEDSTGEHFNVGHTYIGALTILLAIATPIVGLQMFKYKKHIKQLKLAHRWLGRITIIMMLLTIISGMIAAGVI